MIKRLFLSVTLMLAVAVTFGQELSKEELKAQKRQKKALMSLIGDAEKAILDNPAGAIDALRPALEGDQSSLVANETYLWYVLANAKLGVMNQELLKAQEGQSYDEKKVYLYCHDLFKHLALCDSLDNVPDEKGRVKPQYSDQIKKMLLDNWSHLFNGGAYFYNAGDYKNAYNLFDMFVVSAKFPRLAEFDLMNAPGMIENIRLAALYSVNSATEAEDFAAALKHIDLAVQDSANAMNAYQLKAQAQSQLGDTVAWINTLKECSQMFPNNPYFYQNLIQYYDSNNKRNEMIAFADEMIAKDPRNVFFLYVKGYMAAQEQNWDKAIEEYKKALEVDPNYESAILNLSICYLQKAQEYRNSEASTKVTDKAKIAKDKEILDGYYRAALPLCEKMRQLYPDDPSKWSYGLAQCYSFLGMEKEFNEIEKYLPKD